MSGTEVTRVGAGVEYYPLDGGNKNVRLHAAFSHSFGKNGNPAGALLDEQSYVTLGLKWKMNLLSFKK